LDLPIAIVMNRRILLPTDFSKSSKEAIEYAHGLGKDFNLDLILLHAGITGRHISTRIGSRKIVEAIKNSSELGMERLYDAVKKKSASNINISYDIVYSSSITKGVETYAIKNDIDFICIGTKGATGVKKVFFGSNAAKIISKSKVPVITIPENVTYKGIKNIVYSCDLEHMRKELKMLVPYAKLWDAWIHLLHIDKPSENHSEDLISQEKRLMAYASFDKIKTKALEHDSIIKGIDQYVEHIDADMIVMFTHSTSLFEKLYHTSITQMEAFQTKIPLLTFQKE